MPKGGVDLREYLETSSEHSKFLPETSCTPRYGRPSAEHYLRQPRRLQPYSELQKRYDRAVCNLTVTSLRETHVNSRLFPGTLILVLLA